MVEADLDESSSVGFRDPAQLTGEIYWGAFGLLSTQVCAYATIHTCSRRCITGVIANDVGVADVPFLVQTFKLCLSIIFSISLLLLRFGEREGGGGGLCHCIFFWKGCSPYGTVALAVQVCA